MPLELILKRLRKPSVILSIVSQVSTLILLFGFNINENLIMSAAAIICSILVSLGILSNPDSKNKTYGDDMLVCAHSGKLEQHVMVDGKMVCKSCGAVHGED